MTCVVWRERYIFTFSIYLLLYWWQGQLADTIPLRNAKQILQNLFMSTYLNSKKKKKTNHNNKKSPKIPKTLAVSVAPVDSLSANILANNFKRSHVHWTAQLSSSCIFKKIFKHMLNFELQIVLSLRRIQACA